MSLVALTPDNLGDIADGKARLILKDVIGAILQDLDNRGHDLQTREINIKIVAKKVQNSDIVHYQLFADAKLPKYGTHISEGRIHKKVKDGRTQMALMFRDDNGDNVDQPTLNDHVGDESN